MLCQDGYALTQTLSAIKYLETLDHNSLKMSKMDFDKYFF